MHKIVFGQSCEGGSKKHGLVIWMCGNKQYMMFLLDFLAPLVQIDHQQRNEIEPEEYILKGRINHLQDTLHEYL